MRVHMLGVVSLNGGDAAILASEEVILRSQWPDLKLTVSDAAPEAAAKYMPHLEFFPFASTLVSKRAGRSGRLVRRLQALRLSSGMVMARWHRPAAARLILGPRNWAVLEPFVRADVLAYTGGTSLTDNYDLSEKVFDLDLARRLGKPLVFMAQSAGPFAKPWNREGLRPIFEAADLIMLRDQRSKGHVEDVGADPDRCVVVPDVVFALASADLLVGADAEGRPLRVAVSVRRWSHFVGEDPGKGMARYQSAIAAAVVDLVRSANARVTFISTCQGRPEYWLDDSELAQDIADTLPEDVRASVEVDRSAWSPEALVEELGRYDVMISTRLHGAITALCAGTPVLPIAYEFKTVEVFDQLDLGEWVLDIEDVDGPQLLSRVRALVQEREEVVRLMIPAMQRMQAGALAAGPMIAAVLEGRR